MNTQQETPILWSTISRYCIMHNSSKVTYVISNKHFYWVLYDELKYHAEILKYPNAFATKIQRLSRENIFPLICTRAFKTISIMSPQTNLQPKKTTSIKPFII